jgi:hypothetical protein
VQQAPSLDSGRHHADSQSRVSKFVAAGVAVVGAGAIAVSPVSPVTDDIRIQERAVQLSAVANPITEYQKTITAALANLSLISAGTQVSSNALGQALTNPALYEQLATFVGGNILNPLPLLTELAEFQETYGAIISTGFEGSSAATQTALQNLPTVLQNTFNFLAAGEFVEAFSELDIYFLVQLLERPARPLFPVLEVPGDFLASLPGGQIPGALVDSLLVGRASGYARALLAPALTLGLQTAIILDDVRASLEAGDTEQALSDLINLPGKALNAFVNGFDPSGEGIGSTWQGLLSDRGPVDFFTVDLPNAIAAALKVPTTPAITGLNAPSVETARVASGEVASAENTVTLAIEQAPDVKPETAPAAALGTPSTGATTVDTTPLVNTDGATDEIIEVGGEGEEAPASTTPVKKGYQPGDGIKALKKAGDDFNKGVKSFTDSLKPKKKATESEATKDGADDKAKADTDTKDDKPKSDDNDKKSESSES